MSKAGFTLYKMEMDADKEFCCLHKKEKVKRFVSSIANYVAAALCEAGCVGR